MVQYPEVCGVGGSAVAEAMALYNRGQIEHTHISVERCIERGLQYVTETFALFASQGRTVSLAAQPAVDALPISVEQAIRLLFTSNPLHDSTIEATERTYPEFGNLRVDVLSIDRMGVQTVDDYKVKFSALDRAGVEREFLKHLRGEQRLAYTHATGAARFGIILVVLKPLDGKKPLTPFVERRMVTVSQEERNVWLNDVALDYADMDTIVQQVSPSAVRGKAAPHITPYGDCPFMDACTRLELDPARLAEQYLSLDQSTT